jgi:hypothetical protein
VENREGKIFVMIVRDPKLWGLGWVVVVVVVVVLIYVQWESVILSARDLPKGIGTC